MAPFSLRILFFVVLGFVLLFSAIDLLVPRQKKAAPTDVAPEFEVVVSSPAAKAVIESLKSSDKKKSAPKSISVVDWKTLRDLNVKTGQRSPQLDEINGTRVQIPGFMVPLEKDSQMEVSEFLLVPSPQACIHVPPPPPNQMVFAKMSGDSKARVAWIPIWVIGKLKIQNNDSPYGKVSFYIAAESVKPFSNMNERF